MADADVKSPASIDELLRFISSAVSSHYDATNSPVNGAYLADLIRREYPGFNSKYEQFGIAKLADAIAVAEKGGLLIRNRLVKHLEVLPQYAASTTKAPSPVGAGGYIHLREDVWRAFAHISPPDVTWFYDPATGTLLHCRQVADNDDRRRYAQIHPIPLEEQRGWMAEFVRSKPGMELSAAPINDPRCFSEFPLWSGSG